jgi:hypothetical protein
MCTHQRASLTLASTQNKSTTACTCVFIHISVHHSFSLALNYCETFVHLYCVYVSIMHERTTQQALKNHDEGLRMSIGHVLTLSVCSIWQWMPESLHVSVCTCMDDHCVHSSITKHISRLHACKIERVRDKICMHPGITVTFESLNACKCEYCFNICFCVHSSIARSSLRFSSAL